MQGRVILEAGGIAGAVDLPGKRLTCGGGGLVREKAELWGGG